jgi:hypothetical protein
VRISTSPQPAHAFIYEWCRQFRNQVRQFALFQASRRFVVRLENLFGRFLKAFAQSLAVIFKEVERVLELTDLILQPLLQLILERSALLKSADVLHFSRSAIEDLLCLLIEIRKFSADASLAGGLHFEAAYLVVDALLAAALHRHSLKTRVALDQRDRISKRFHQMYFDDVFGIEVGYEGCD